MSATDKTSLLPAFEQATQFKHWRYSQSQLDQLRAERYDEASKEHINITAEEEAILFRYYVNQLQGTCKRLKINEDIDEKSPEKLKIVENLKRLKNEDEIVATAVIYLKRFFLRCTVYDYHPKDILLTCLFLATKCENAQISMDEFGKGFELPEEACSLILKLEFTVSQVLRFEYYIHHPYRPAYGFYLDMQTHVDLQLLNEIYDKVPAVIAEILMTDLPLIYQPSQLALAAFWAAAKKDNTQTHIQTYIESQHGASAAGLLDLIRQITNILDTVEPLSRDQARQIASRLPEIHRNKRRNSTSSDNSRGNKKHRQGGETSESSDDSISSDSSSSGEE